MEKRKMEKLLVGDFLINQDTGGLHVIRDIYPPEYQAGDDVDVIVYVNARKNPLSRDLVDSYGHQYREAQGHEVESVLNALVFRHSNTIKEIEKILDTLVNLKKDNAVS
jgi:hypothetical protein